MSETSPPPGSEPAPASAPAPPHKPLGQRLLLIGGVIVVLVIAYFIAAASIPRWWSHRIGDQVDGSQTAGIGIGLFYGFVFTFLPLLVLSFALRRKRTWKARGWLLAVAVILALPNLFTLGIVLGTGSAAHAGERTLDVEAPAFRAATLVGAILGALAVVGVRYMLDSRKRHKTREAELRTELRTRDQAAKAAAAAQGDEAPKD